MYVYMCAVCVCMCEDVHTPHLHVSLWDLVG